MKWPTFYFADIFLVSLPIFMKHVTIVPADLVSCWVKTQVKILDPHLLQVSEIIEWHMQSHYLNRKPQKFRKQGTRMYTYKLMYM